MIEIVLTGYYIDESSRVQLPLLKNPTENQLIKTLELFEGKYGEVGLENTLANSDEGPIEITLYSELGNYLVMMNDIDDEGYYNVRTLYREVENGEPDYSLMHGEAYGTNTIVKDMSLVKQAFLEFLKTGNVSKELMDA